jgi:hypothetical protein
MRWTARAVVALTVGTAAWFLLVVGPADSRGPRVNTYLPALCVAAAALGATLGGDLLVSLVVGVLLGAPGLYAAPATAPRGDGDGLWILIFPTIVFAMALAAACHAAAAAVVARLRTRSR